MNPTNARRRLFITALYDNHILSLGKDLARRHPPANFIITESREDAEIILYIENEYIGLAELPRLLHCVRSLPSAKHLLFSESDWPFPVLPGAYPSLYKPCSWAHSWCYMPRPDIESAAALRTPKEPQFLFSFLGRVWTHPVRKRILLLDNVNSPCLDVADGSKRVSGYEYTKSYWSMISNSKFVLCPRGFGASSFRIFEAMSLGRVPVIVSDEWRRPPKVSWDEFCVFVPENEVAEIPDILGALEGSFREMGKMAREAYDEYFSPKVFFDRLLITMLSMYSGYDFSVEAGLSRAWRSLGLREIRTIGSQIKARAANILFRGAES